MKKLFCLLLVAFMAFAPTISKAEASTPLSLEDVERMIVESVLSDMSPTAISVEVVPVESASSARFSAGQAKAIKTVELLEDGRTAVELNVPYKKLDDGELVNSFQYVALLGYGEYEYAAYTTNFVDITITLRAYYTYVGISPFRLYKMHDAYFSWNYRVGSAPYIESARVVSGVDADLYSYTSADVFGNVQGVNLIQRNYSRSVEINLTRPRAGSGHYTDFVMSFYETRAVNPVGGGIDRGGYAAVDFSYIDTNGNSRPGQLTVMAFTP